MQHVTSSLSFPALDEPDLRPLRETDEPDIPALGEGYAFGQLLDLLEPLLIGGDQRHPAHRRLDGAHPFGVVIRVKGYCGDDGVDQPGLLIHGG